jgi:hypothetical protein
MKEVEGPAPVMVAALDHGFDGFTDAAVGFDSRIPQIIESTQDVVVPKCRILTPLTFWLLLHREGHGRGVAAWKSQPFRRRFANDSDDAGRRRAEH